MKHRIHVNKEVAQHMKDFHTNMPEKTPVPPAEPEEEQAKETDITGQEEAVVAENGAAAADNEAAAATEAKADDAPFVVAVRTHIGKVRSSNQDAVIEAGRLVGVADGMGGHQGGETASAGVRDHLIAYLKSASPDPTVLSRAIKAANRRLFIQAQETPSLRGMGTTLSVLWLGDECAYIGHVGDSRVYRMQGEELEQITDDHSYVMEMVRAGLITQEEAATHPMRNVITRAVGTEGGVDVDVKAAVRKPGDIWLICSDGLHGMVKEPQMAELLRNNPPEQAADLLLQAALDAGGRDNISLVVLLDKEGAK